MSVACHCHISRKRHTSLKLKSAIATEDKEIAGGGKLKLSQRGLIKDEKRWVIIQHQLSQALTGWKSMTVTQQVKKCWNSKWQRYSRPISLKRVKRCGKRFQWPAQLMIHVSMFICFQPTNHWNYAAIFSRRTGSQFAVCVTSGWHSIAVCFAQIFSFCFSFVIVLIFVRFSHCSVYFYIVFISQIVIVLAFVHTERSAIVLVFIFVMKIALKCSR